LNELAGWIAWLVNAYRVEVVPDCWYWHEGAVDAMIGLRRWHDGLTNELAADVTAVCAWHDALFRIEKHILRPLPQRCLTTHRGDWHLKPVNRDTFAQHWR
jgi:hypothetical protein